MIDETPATEAIRTTGIAYRVVRTARAGSAKEAATLQGIELGALLRSIVVRQAVVERHRARVAAVAWQSRARAAMARSHRFRLDDRSE